MTFEYIKSERFGAVLVITLDDPPTRNALGNHMGRELTAELASFESDDSLRALVITGRDPAFCSGANLKELGQRAQKRVEKRAQDAGYASPWVRMETRKTSIATDTDSDSLRYLPSRVYNLQKPTIAAVNGYAMGVGMGIALSCDIRIASEEARMAEAFIKTGLVPGDGSCWQLPRLIGLGNTLLLQYTGDVIDAHECYRLGLVNRLVPHKDLMSVTMDLAQRLAQGPTYSMGLIKWLVHKSSTSSLEESLAQAGTALKFAMDTEDYKEGVRAFVEKRKPDFKGK